MIGGHLEQDRDKDGKRFWRVRLDYGIDPVSGKRDQPRDPGIWYDVREAKRQLAERLHEANHGPRIDTTKQTISTIVAAWLDQEATESVRHKTIKDYRGCCNKHIVPAIGHVPAQQLTTAMVQQFRSGLLARGNSPHVAKRATLHLSQVLNFAVRQGWLSHNPAKGIKPLKLPHTEMQVWDAAEASRFLVAARDAIYSPLWLLALSTGMRQGELLALRWADVDLTRGTLAVRRSVDRQHHEDAPKSGKARTLHLEPNCVDALAAHQLVQNERRKKLGPAWQRRDLVFASTTGDHLMATNVYRAFVRIMDEASIRKIRFHDCRHTAASLMLQAGVPVKVVSEMLGHANVTITLNLYTHVLPGMSKEASATLGRLLSSGA